ncbi:MAG: HesA/MoeB/ThiF family protein [Armatimonadetes bacterium]|nr:HesA/MoeB/ThiF family protein [Armatimonadota bacterium]
MVPLTDWEIEKYKRQIQIPGFGEEAQRKLKASSALVTRVGGLGGPASIWLAAAGIGKLVIAHDGNVTPSNLNRQILMRGDGVGQPRSPQAKETLLRFNPDLEVVAYQAHAGADNVEELVSQVDLVCDCTPDFAERLVLNAECWRQGKPMIESAMDGMEAHLQTIIPPDTPCLQCRVPGVPEWWDVYGFGVLGAVPGALGALTALEAIKVLTGFGRTLAGRLLVLDTEDMSLNTFTLGKRPDCPICGGARAGGT